MVSDINYIKELYEGTFPINLKLIQKYQQVEPSILAKYVMLLTIRITFVEVVILILNLLVFCQNSKVTYCISTIRISLFQ